ncbi:bifunctional diguanylate cyclase/phosphodiesterase [Polaromonas sp. JS666]|uniref:bifunctional diguanylate cyclase/phosphodiesterase n=1 Tax=Polaromonas sp. (strain JS666 / ATCC BAA-500) TaxID=296591 RepID=UPI0000464DBE|nr:LapD/MoxY N-terminal periplasmic domain-containing protein [Polaromonas sp. JS666]ABE42273.1 diguanylate cyclase/phosphodiesterase [Polaromonas sp. JS666]
MSLIKQLWIAIIVVMTIAFGGSMVVSVLSARHYLEQQLQVKNIDNATALALSLSQLPKDPVTVELQVATQFDAGHYRFIRIVSPTGQTVVERVFTGQLQGAPAWFARLIPIRAVPGQALIQDGWKQYGTLTLASHEQYVYKSLWDGTLELLLWFVLGSVITGIAGTLAIRFITRPLGDVVGQAEAIAERRFLRIAEPRTPELRSVVRAMNSMVERLKALFSEEAARLEALRQKVNLDALTGLSGREHFLSQLRELLVGEDSGAEGVLVMLRVNDLNMLNARLGHQRADTLLQQLGGVLKDSMREHSGQQAGRLKGGDFALACPGITSPAQAASELHQRLNQAWLPNWVAEVPDLFHLAAVPYQRAESIGDLLSRADEALARAEAEGPNSWHASEADSGSTARPAEQWRSLLTEAVASGKLRLAFYRVVGSGSQNAIHQEGVIRLQIDDTGTLLPARDFMPMAAHLNLSAPIDLEVVRLAIAHLRTTPGDIAVNLSAETIADFSFRYELRMLLEFHPEICKRLLFEVPEQGVFKQFNAFRDLVLTLKPLGCRVGIEYFGQRFAEGDKLADLGLDYIKVHPSYVRDIAHNPGNQEFLKGLCKVARNFGIVVIALGVESDSDLPLLASLGFDGVTGPGVK